MKVIAVVGGGVSGLSCSYFAKQCLERSTGGGRVVLIEKAANVGGWFWSQRDEATGILLERGPHSFRPVGPSGLSAMKLVEELGLEKEAIGTSKSSAIRYLWVNGKMHKLPTSLVELFTGKLTWPLPWLGLREALVVPKRSKDLGEDESVYDFFSRRFSRYVADYFADALTQGIFAGDVRQLSVRSCFPVLYEMEQEYGSVVRGMVLSSRRPKIVPPGLELQTEEGKELIKCAGVSFPDGLGRLTNEIATQTFEKKREDSKVETELICGKRVESISRDGVLTLDDGQIIKADDVISTVPLPQLNQMLAQGTRGQQALTDLISKTRYSSVGVVNLGYTDMNSLPNKGFGHLIPTNQMEGVLGMIYDSEVFPAQQPSGTSCLTVMMGGVQFPGYARLPPEEMTQVAIDKVREHLNITQTPAACCAVTHQNAIPQYPLNHHRMVQNMRNLLTSEYPNLRITGNHLEGVGIADTIARARTTVTQLSENQN